MEESYIEPDPGQQIKLKINDYEDAVYTAYRHGYQTYIGQIRVKVIDYELLGVLVHQYGHRARVLVEGVWNTVNKKMLRSN